MKNALFLAVLAFGFFLAQSVLASSFTMASPSGALPSSVSAVGGIVLDLEGLNGNRVVSQLAASSLIEGFASTNPMDIGTQFGFTTAVINALGAGLASVAVRITLSDGDSSLGNFDYNENTLLLNGYEIGNFSDVITQITDATGNPTQVGTVSGFSDNLLNTGFFSSSNSIFLNNLYASLFTGSIVYSLYDKTPGDNYYDFTQGINVNMLEIAQGPTVTSAVPEPSSMLLLGLGSLISLAYVRRRS